MAEKHELRVICGAPGKGASGMETVWKQGDRVVSRFWEPGEPVGTVLYMETSTRPFKRDAFSRPEVPASPVEWVTVRFDDGYEKEYAAWDLRKAPDCR